MTGKDFLNAPHDVLWVYALQIVGNPVGLETHRKIHQIIKDNPKYFPSAHNNGDRN